MKYRCKHCGVVTWRDSTKKRIKSWCEHTGKTVYLQKVDDSVALQHVNLNYLQT